MKLKCPEIYRQIVKPRYKKITDFIKARSDAKIFFYSCGALREVIPDMIDVGIDIINLVQVSAAGMESAALKRDFDQDIIFWGELADTQDIFTHGTPQQVSGGGSSIKGRRRSAASSNSGDGDYFLPEMMLAASGTRGIMDILRPLLTEAGSEPMAVAIIGTVKGNLHDIGKNLVGMMLERTGFEIIDLGVDIAPENFVQAIRDSNAQLVGLSALLTTTMPMMHKIIQEMETAGVRDQVQVMVGGAGVTQAYANDIGADGYAPDASAAVRKAKELLAAFA
jgi:methylmalonyl-CoA mutase cobalamin-binding domain/chain